MPNPTEDARATVRKSLSLLNAVVILQPVGDPELERLFPDGTAIMESLKNARMLRKLSDGMWVATARGLGVASTHEMGRKRDVQRMFQLIERTRRR